MGVGHRSRQLCRRSPLVGAGGLAPWLAMPLVCKSLALHSLWSPPMAPRSVRPLPGIPEGATTPAPSHGPSVSLDTAMAREHLQRWGYRWAYSVEDILYPYPHGLHGAALWAHYTRFCQWRSETRDRRLASFRRALQLVDSLPAPTFQPCQNCGRLDTVWLVPRLRCFPCLTHSLHAGDAPWP